MSRETQGPIPAPRFFFDVPDVRPDFADDTGLDMPDAHAAFREAVMAAVAMLKDATVRGVDAVSLDVRDEGGRRTCQVTAEIRFAKR